MTRSEVAISQWPFHLGLCSRYRDANAREHVVHQHIIDMALADEVPDKYPRRLIGVFDTFRQALPADLFSLLLHIAHELFWKFTIVQSECEVARGASSESGRARCRADGVTACMPHERHRRWLEKAVGGQRWEPAGGRK
jgi:hypothetical protein